LNRSGGQPDYRAHSGSHYRYPDQVRSQAYGSGSGSAAGSDAGGMVSRAARQVGEMASTAQERVGDITETVQEQVSAMAGAGLDRRPRAPGEVQRMIAERAVAAAAVAASRGAAGGLGLPPTQAERRLLGPTSGQAMGKAPAVAGAPMEKVQDVGQEVPSTAA